MAAFPPVEPTGLGLGPIQNPLGLEAADGLQWVIGGLVWSLTLIGAISVFVRLHSARGIERLQLKWVTYATAIAVNGAIVRYFVFEALHVSWVWWVGLILLIAGLVGIPIAMGVAILRCRLYQIDLIINRTLVYVRSRPYWRWCM